MGETLIGFDTETTGFTEKEPTALDKQPHIVEFAAIKIDYDTMEEIDRLEFICKPPIKLSPEIIKITGIQNKAGIISDETGEELPSVEFKQPFKAHLRDLVQFFFGTRHMICHNLTYDRDMLWYELQRIGFLTRFPWPPNHVCTVEKSKTIKGYDLNLSALHEHFFGEKFEGAHRAMVDVEAMMKCYRKLREEKYI